MYPKDQLRRALKLYAITDETWLYDRSLADCVADALAGGATCIQLRDKTATTEELVVKARGLLPLCHTANVPFLIDDNVEAARISGADGVHLGQSDLTCRYAREVLGDDAIVGVSAHTPAEAREAEAAGADYLGVGALIATPTKPDADIVTSETLRDICSAVHIPVVGIGGLNCRTMSCLADTGVAGAAVISAVFAARDIKCATQDLAHCIIDIIKT